jgi:hypothetical protein
MSSQNPISDTTLVEICGSGIPDFVCLLGLQALGSLKAGLPTGITERVAEAFGQDRSAA